MKKIRIFKVSLEPLDWFFFGGENTFDNGVKQSYIAHSNLFPQQTALLGMIRYQLLKQKGLLITEDPPKTDSETVSNLIGKESFMMGYEKQNFGVIKKLSPVFIEKRDKHTSGASAFFPVPLINGYDICFDENVKVCLNGVVKNQLIQDNETFDHKLYKNYEKYQKDKSETISSSDIFQTRMMIGITINSDNVKSEDDKGRFYKREMVRFNNTGDYFFCFAFYVSLDDYELMDDFVFLGAERSCFRMNVKEITESGKKSLTELFLDKRVINERSEGRIELLSNTFVSDINELNRLCNFHWSYQTPFRNITRSLNNEGKLNSGIISYHRKNICYNMLCTGSVLFFHEKNRSDIERLLNCEQLQSIGYNYFETMNK